MVIQHSLQVICGAEDRLALVVLGLKQQRLPLFLHTVELDFKLVLLRGLLRLVVDDLHLLGVLSKALLQQPGQGQRTVTLLLHERRKWQRRLKILPVAQAQAWVAQ